MRIDFKAMLSKTEGTEIYNTISLVQIRNTFMCNTTVSINDMSNILEFLPKWVRTVNKFGGKKREKNPTKSPLKELKNGVPRTKQYS